MTDLVKRARQIANDMAKEGWYTQGAHVDKLADRIEALETGVLNAADMIEKIAFEIKPPNQFTPRLVMMANGLRFLTRAELDKTDD
tara:strand:- start:800 stop:1057 length:258 start_codon:yes stop_codon:yes gene_type:complete